MTRLLAIGLLAFAVAGCGGRSSDQQAASTTSTSPPPTATTSTSTSADCHLKGAVKAPQVSDSTQISDEPMYLTDVSISSDKCARSVVFDLEPNDLLPGFRVSYEPAETAKVEDASGNPVEVAGDAFLVVKLRPAMTAKIDGDQVTKTYTGPNRIPGQAPVTEVVKAGDFEGVVTWVIGLDHVRPYLTTGADGMLFVDIENS